MDRRSLLAALTIATVLTGCKEKRDVDPVTGIPYGQSKVSPLAVGCFAPVSSRGLPSRDSVWISKIDRIEATDELVSFPEYRRANFRRLIVTEVGKPPGSNRADWYVDQRSRTVMIIGDLNSAHILRFTPDSQMVLATLEYGTDVSAKNDTLGVVGLRRVSCG